MPQPGPDRDATAALRRAAAAAVGNGLLGRWAPAAGAPGGTKGRISAQVSAAPADQTNPPPRPAARLPVGSKPLPPRQLTAARLLLAGRRVNEVASVLGVNRHTIARWSNDPRFQAELRRQADAAADDDAAAAGRAGAPWHIPAPGGARSPSRPADKTNPTPPPVLPPPTTPAERLLQALGLDGP